MNDYRSAETVIEFPVFLIFFFFWIKNVIIMNKIRLEWVLLTMHLCGKAVKKKMQDISSLKKILKKAYLKTSKINRTFIHCAAVRHVS